MTVKAWEAPSVDGWPRFGGQGSGDGGIGSSGVDAGAAPRVVDVAGAERVDVGSANLLLEGDYARDGADLILSDGAGRTLILRDYFLDETPADLVVGEGMRVDGALATRLAGPQAPGQVAQAATLGGDALADAIGTVTKAEGVVTVIRADGTSVTVEAGDPVFQGDIVTTSGDGGIGISFVDGSAFSLGGSGRMVLDELVYDPGTGEGSSSVSLMSGVFSFVSGEIAKSGPDAMTVTTPVATIGVRGTKGVIRLEVPEGADLGDMNALRDRAEALGLQLEVVLLPENAGTTGEIVFTPVNGPATTLNVAYEGIKVGLSRILGQVELSVSRFTANEIDFMGGDRGRSLDFLPDNGADGDDDSDVDGNEQGSIDLDGDGRPSLSEILRQDPNYADPFDVVGKGTGSGGGGNSEDVDKFVKRVLDTVLDDGLVLVDAEGDDKGGDGGSGDDVLGDGTDDDADGVVDGVKTNNGRIVVAFSGGVYDASNSTDNLEITGGSSGDTITTGSGDDLIFGGAGADVIKTNGGDDIVFGGSGADIIIGGSGQGNDTYYGGSSAQVDDSANDWVKYPSATRAITVDLSAGRATGLDIDTDVLYGIEHVLGGDGSDTITGNTKNNILQGGSGDDTLDGGKGQDTLEGGAGNDTLVYSVGKDTYKGGSGTDSLLVRGGTTLNLTSAWQSGSSSLEGIVLGTGANTLVVGSKTSWSSIFGDTLYVQAGSDDTVSGSGWTYVGTVVVDGVAYNSWTQSGKTLNVQTSAQLSGLSTSTSGGGDDGGSDGGGDGNTSATLTWDGGAEGGTSFTEADNWDTDTVPDSNDTAVISGDHTATVYGDVEIGSVVLSSGAYLNVDGELTLASGGTVDQSSSLMVGTSGVLNTDGTLDVSGSVSFSSGATLGGEGTIVLGTAGELVSSGGTLYLDEGTLRLTANQTLDGALVQSDGGTLEVDAQSTLTILDSGSISGTGTLDVYGTVDVNDCSGDTTFGSITDLHGGGVIKSTQGSFTLGSGTYAGSIQMVSGYYAVLSGDQIYNEGVSWSGGGNFQLMDGSIALNTDLDSSVAFWAGGSSRLTGTGTLTVATFDQSSTTGTLDIDSSAMVVTDGGYLSGMTVLGSGTLVLSGGTFVIDGSMATTTEITADIEVQSGATLALRGDGTTATLDLDAQGEVGGVTIKEGGVLVLDSLTGTEGAIIDGGTGTLTNAGEIQVLNTSGTGTATINGAFVQQSTGTLNVDATLYLAPGDGKTADLGQGTIDIADWQHVVLNTGTLITGAGTTYVGAGENSKLSFRDGTTWVLNDDFTSDATTFRLKFEGAVMVTTQAATVPLLINDFSLTLSDDTFDVNLKNTGTMFVDSSDGAETTLREDFTNTGTVILRTNADNEAVTLNVEGTLVNSAFMSFDNVDNMGTVAIDMGDGLFTNSGTLSFWADVNGDNTYTVTSNFVNSGSVYIDHDVTFAQGNFQNQNHGTVTLHGGATLYYSPADGSFSNLSGGLIEGVGTIDLSYEFSPGELGYHTLSNAGTIAPGYGTGAGTLAHGGLYIDGWVTLEDTSNLILDLDTTGTLGGNDSFEVSQDLTLGGTLTINLVGDKIDDGLYEDMLIASSFHGQFDYIDGMNQAGDTNILFPQLSTTYGGQDVLTFSSMAVTGTDIYLGTTNADTFTVDGTLYDEDIFVGLGGDDTVHMNDMYFYFLDGGEGVDTIEIDNVAALDWSDVSWETVQGFEEMTFGGTIDGTLTLTDTVVDALTSGTNALLSGKTSPYSATNALVIHTNDVNDVVDLVSEDGTWSQTGTVSMDLDGDTNYESYSVYSNGEGVTVYVDGGGTVKVDSDTGVGVGA
jgi:hypothetical protein